MLSLGEDVETVAESAMLGLTLDVKVQEGTRAPRIERWWAWIASLMAMA